MKKFIHTLLAVSIIFSACKKVECEAAILPITSDGCTDSTASNYDPLATVDDGSCIFQADKVLKAIHPHPTMSEAVMEAVADAYDEVIHI